MNKELCKRKRRAAEEIKILSQKPLKLVIKFSYSRELTKVLLVKAFCCKYNREKKLLLISKILRQNFNFPACASLTFTKLFRWGVEKS